MIKRYAFGVVFQAISGTLVRVSDKEIVIKPIKAFDLGDPKDMSTLDRQTLSRDVWAVVPRNPKTKARLSAIRRTLLQAHRDLSRFVSREG